jgi:hypothetical protein
MENSETIKINEDELNDIINLSNDSDQMYFRLGILEAQKFDVLRRLDETRQMIDSKAKQAILNAGINETDIVNYKVDIATGEILKK